MLKALKIALIALFGLSIAPPGFAKELKVGCVDVIEVFNNYAKTQKMEGELLKRADEYKGKRDAQIEGIKQLRDKIALLSDKAKESQQKELEEKAGELRDFEAKNIREIQQDRDETRREILEEIETFIQEYAKTNGYDLIIYRNMVVFSLPTMDLTDKVLEGLNAAYKKKK